VDKRRGQLFAVVSSLLGGRFS